MRHYFVGRCLMFIFVVYVSFKVGGSQTFAVNLNLPEKEMKDDFKNEFSLEAAINSELNEYRDRLNKKYNNANYYNEEVNVNDDADDDGKGEKYEAEHDAASDDDDEDNNEIYKSEYNVDVDVDVDGDNNNDNDNESSSKVNIKEDIIQTDDDYIIAKRRLMSRDYPIRKLKKSKKTSKPYRRMKSNSNLHIKESSGQPPSPKYKQYPNLVDAECQTAKCATRDSFLGTNLFGPRRKKCFYSQDLALLSARYEFETIIPKTYPPGLVTNKDICLLLRYFSLINAQIERIDDEKSQRLIQRAYFDSLGAYLHYYLVPNVKFAFYAGRISLCSAKRVLKTYEECKMALNTNGNGWKTTNLNVFTEEIINTIKALYVKPQNASVGITSCSLLDLRSAPKDGVQQQLLVALPKLEPVGEEDNYIANVFLPFDKRRVFNLLSTKCAFIFVKFYKILTYCHRNQRVSMGNYNYKLYNWIEDHLRDHMCDDEFYPGMGGILNVYMATKLCKKKRDYADELREADNKEQDYDSADMGFLIKEPLSISILDKTKFTRSIGSNNEFASKKGSKSDTMEPTECPCPTGMSQPCEVLGLIKSNDTKKGKLKKPSMDFTPPKKEEKSETTQAPIDIDKKNLPYISKTIQATAGEDEDDDDNPLWDFINDNLIIEIAAGVGAFLVLITCIICCCCCCCRKKKEEKDEKKVQKEEEEPKEEGQLKVPEKKIPEPITKPFWGLCHSRKRSRYVIKKIREEQSNTSKYSETPTTTPQPQSPSTPTPGAMPFIKIDRMSPNITNIRKQRAGKRYTKDYDDITTMTSSTDQTTPTDRSYFSKMFAKKKVPPDNRSYYIGIEKVSTDPVSSMSKTYVDSTTTPQSSPKSTIKQTDSLFKKQQKVKLSKASRIYQKAKEKSQSAKHLADLSEMSKPPSIPIKSSSDPMVKKDLSSPKLKGNIFKRQKAGMDDDFNGSRDQDWETTYSSTSH